MCVGGGDEYGCWYYRGHSNGMRFYGAEKKKKKEREKKRERESETKVKKQRQKKRTIASRSV